MTPAYPKIDSKILCMCVPVSENRAPLIWPQSLYLQKGESSYCEVARKQKRRGKAGLCGSLREEGGKRWLLKARRAMLKEGRGLVGKDFRCRGLYRWGRKQKGRWEIWITNGATEGEKRTPKPQMHSWRPGWTLGKASFFLPWKNNL